MTILKITQIPQLNSIVIKQEQGHFFIAAPNSIIIDKVGWLRLTEELVRIGFLHQVDVLIALNKSIIREVEDANKEDSSNTTSG
jgi:hypothetical protein